MAKTDFKTVDEYIGTFGQSIQDILRKIRTGILLAVPGADEAISYQIPAYKIGGKYFIYFSGFQKHVSLYPAPLGNYPFKKKLMPYLSGKRTIKFPVDKPIPFELVGEVARFLAKEKISRANNKK